MQVRLGSLLLVMGLSLLACAAPTAVPAPSEPVSPAPLTQLPASPAVQAEPATPTSPAPTPDLESRPQLWFGPLPPMPTGEGRPFTGSDDFMQLFDHEAAWSQAAAGLHVFKLYGEWVAYHATDAELEQAIAEIRRRGLALAVEAGPLNATEQCGAGVEGFAGSDEGALIASRIRQAGDQLDLIALDEPYFYAHVYDGANACHWPPIQIAEGVDAFIQQMQTEFPGVIIGDTEPLAGTTTAQEYLGWLSTFRQVAGYDLAFLHMDVDWSRPAWSQEVAAIEQGGQALGVPVGIIYTGNFIDPDDEAWLSVAGERVKRHELADGAAPDHILFQSWNDHPDHVLPESDAYTFTGFIRTYLSDRSALGWRRQGAGANLAFGRPVRVSALEAGHPAAHAVDGDLGTWWGAGGPPSQWIEIDLDGPQTIASLRLTPSQFPAGPTVHRVLASGPETGGSFVHLHTFREETQDGQPLVVTPESPWTGIERLMVVTDSSPSWIAWREIEVFGG